MTTPNEAQASTALEKVFGGRVQAAVAAILGGDKKRARSFMTSAWYAATTTRGLDACTATSIGTALVQAAQLGLTVGGPAGEAWVLPFGADEDGNGGGRNRVKNAHLAVGYKGWLSLHRRAGVRDIAVHLVYEDELETFELNLGDRPGVKHRRALSSRETVPVVGGYSIAWVQDAEHPSIFWMPLADIEKRRAASKSWRNGKGPWVDWPEPMQRKTILRAHSALLPNSDEITAAGEADLRADGHAPRPVALLDEAPRLLEADFNAAATADAAALKEHLRKHQAKEPAPAREETEEEIRAFEQRLRLDEEGR